MPPVKKIAVPTPGSDWKTEGYAVRSKTDPNVKPWLIKPGSYVVCMVNAGRITLDPGRIDLSLDSFHALFQKA